MNNGPLLFLGILATLASSFWGLVLLPQLQIGRQQPVVLQTTGQPYPSARSGEARQGAEVYRSLGCVECHSQQVRQTGAEFEVRVIEAGTNKPGLIEAIGRVKPSLAADSAKLVEQLPTTILRKLTGAQAQAAVKQLLETDAKAEAVLVPLGPDMQRGWGRRLSVAQDYLYDQPALLGWQRIGPDLANAGARLTDAQWHLRHLYDPRLTVPGSPMPRYPFLFEKRPVAAGRARSAGAIQTEPATDAKFEIVPKPAARALVAYLLSLQADAPLFEAPAPKPLKLAAAAATNAPAPAK